jgi:hypothetical protein
MGAIILEIGTIRITQIPRSVTIPRIRAIFTWRKRSIDVAKIIMEITKIITQITIEMGSSIENGQSRSPFTHEPKWTSSIATVFSSACKACTSVVAATATVIATWHSKTQFRAVVPLNLLPGNIYHMGA